jgi:hypothetical protein
MRTSILPFVVTLLLLAGCSSQNRQDTVPETFTVKNNSATAVAIKLYSGRTHGIGSLPPTLTELEFSQNQVNPGTSRENVPVDGYIDGDSVYFQVYAESNGIRGVVLSRLVNNIEIIRQRKLLVYQGP